ncbi:hypothetical protein CYMTET_55370 [Cymbomonas tetramitiformis]|uniref:DNA primase n=1 Tax=Cymbomonas tetramitiformis TaxID=36881 RepID=A0AAE0BD42_9CHLO|nr:hypothetical protein CYMTET_55370 [Cymbomonas tetramitiformis]|eukprot:gene17964-21395_t
MVSTAMESEEQYVANKKMRLSEQGTESKATPMEMDGRMATAKFDETGRVHDLMPLYYGRLFPTNDMYRWLAYGHDKKHPQADQEFFQRREFCFTLEGDIFCRYQSFKDGAELLAALRDKVPEKIDLGPIYNVDPKRRAAYSSLGGDRVFAPVERELVFDVDMTDYDDVRTCCSGADICGKCWPLMTVAIQVIDRGLREDFGYRNLLWVYSGRRGVHCWVCDSRARKMSNEARTAVAEYFSVYRGGEKAEKRVATTHDLHPSLNTAFEVLEKHFLEHILPKQELLENSEQIGKILEMFPDADLRATLEEKLQKNLEKKESGRNFQDSVELWQELERAVGRKKNRALFKALKDVVFVYTYPRLDVEVSKHMNHLLKAPFCVHPKTGRVCVPMDPAKADQFDPADVPTVAQLLNELDEHEANYGKENAVKGEEASNTSMGKYMEMFRSAFLDGLMSDVKLEFAQSAKVANKIADATKPLDW